MELSKEQTIAFNKYIQGHNIFITGPGGSGKSELIRMINHHAYRNFKDIHVTALTGCAAILLNCKATTLHSWAGIGLGNGTVEQLIRKITSSNFAKELWKTTDILVVDEVSMLSLKLFETLNTIGKKIRNNHLPFGGIQLIFSGDFFQLPPVGDKDEPDTQRFCFESIMWNETFNPENQIQFKKIFRQREEIYSTILNQIREGKIKRRSCDLLMEYVGRPVAPNLITEPTKLFPRKKQVEQINAIKMDSLSGETKVYNIEYDRDLGNDKNRKNRRINITEREIQAELDFLVGNLICDKEIKLKIGSQVMCIVNMKTQTGEVILCNGSQGIVINFNDNGLPIVLYNNGLELIMYKHTWKSENIPGIGVSQIPLILAWALTIHKSQGATMDAAEIDIGSGIFECGQTYVAISRVRSLDGLYLTSFDPKRIRINRKAQEYYENLTLLTSGKEDNNIPIVVAEVVNTNNNDDIYVEASIVTNAITINENDETNTDNI